MVKILGLPFDDYVNKQVKIRQSKLAKQTKSPEELVVFNANTAWLRITSGVSIEPERARVLASKLGIPVAQVQGKNLAKNLVLWGGASSFSEDTTTGDMSLGKPRGGVGYGLGNAYGFLTTSDQGYKPMPGITGMTCNYKNNGSLLQARVTLKCYSRSQFEAIEAIYLRLGYTLVMEWGNTIWFNNDGEKKETTQFSLPNIIFNSLNDQPDPGDLRRKILENRRQTSGNYDAMIAKVANYSWALQNDLSFDITLELISVGDIIESLKVNVGGSGQPRTAVTDEGNIQNTFSIIVNKNASQLNEFFYELYDKIFKQQGQKYGSNETKELIKKLDQDEQSIEKLDRVQKEFTQALLPFEETVTALNKAFEIAEKSTYNPGKGVFSVPENSRTEWENILQQLGTTTTLLVLALYDQRSGEIYKQAQTDSLDNFAKSVEAINKWATNLNYSTDESRNNINALSSSNVTYEEMIYRALNGSPIIDSPEIKIPGGQWQDNSTLGYQLTRIIQNRFSKYDGLRP